MFNRAWAEIDLSAFKTNLSLIRKKVGSEVQILVPIKADGYGHGLEQVAVELAQNHVDWLGVANILEAKRIREVLPQIPILILGLSFKEEAEEILNENVSCVVSSIDFLEELNHVATLQNKKAKIHLKIDTGMGRIGVKPDQAIPFIEKLKTYSHLQLEGICTHFPSADQPNDLFTQDQIEKFNQILVECYNRNWLIPYVHLANSSGLLNYPESYHNLVRLGLLVYGVSPVKTDQPKEEAYFSLFKPLLQLKSRLLYIKEVQAAQSISYGRTFTTSQQTHIGTIPIGYADGYPRSLSNKAQVLINGKRYPIVGQVTMDQIMVDLSPQCQVQEGDEVILLGKSQQDQITATELANWASTIPYEILTNLGERIHRVYVEDTSSLLTKL